jgi:nicotinate-nucleotide adenylyltransferase
LAKPKAKKQKKPTKQTKRGKLIKPPKRAKPAKQAKPSKPSKQAKQAKSLKAAKPSKQAKRAEKKPAAASRSAATRKSGDRKDGKARASLREVTRLPMAAPHMRIGLLGGSFNSAHEAHLEISLTALKRLQLDQVWWLVSPGNPLKDASKLPSLKERVQAARDLAKHPRIAVSGFDGGKGSAYTIDLLTELKRRYPGVNFVWLMGADNLAGFHHWRAWQEIFALMPVAVFDRPGFRLKARASNAAQRFSAYHVDESDASGLARFQPPAWTILSHPLSRLSSTELRAKKPAKKKEKGKDKKRKKKGK